MSEPVSEQPNAVISQFVFERLLNQDSQGRRIVLLGQIQSQPALLTVERAAFSSSSDHLSAFISSLTDLQTLGDNDIYRWYLARASSSASSTATDRAPHDLKLNLIYPCTPKHIAKYTPQTLRYVVETPSIYAKHVRPWIVAQRDQGRLNWVFNILEGRTEQENVLYRSWDVASTAAVDKAVEDGWFLLLPDLNWDRVTLSALHLLCLPWRRDKWSVRDLGKRDVPWLRTMMARLADTAKELYGVERSGIKFYLHYQPTYHHLHIHIVSTMLDAGVTQAVGKAIDLELVIGILEALPRDEASMADVPLAYTVGEGTELWKTVWEPIMEKVTDA